MSYDTKVRIGKIIILSIVWTMIIGLFALNIWLTTYCWKLHYTMYTNEFNAQMSMFGFYDKERRILNQKNVDIKLAWLLTINVFSYLLIPCGGAVVLFNLDNIFDWW